MRGTKQEALAAGMAGSDQGIDAALAAWLRGGAMPDALARAPRDALLLRIDLHGLGPTLARMAEGAPDDLSAALRDRLVAREFWEAQHARILAEALDALAAAGLHPLVMKGSALAHSIYPSPAERMRGDSDVLVEPEGREAAAAAMEAAGFAAPQDAGGAILVGEALYQKADPTGVVHDIDLHWRFSNAAFQARLYTHAELAARARPIAVGRATARRPEDVDALLLACVHRVSHVGGTGHITLNGVPHPVIDSLTWLRDLDLLARRLDPEAWDRFWTRADARDVAEICAKGLLDAHAALGTPIPADAVAAHAARPPGPMATYLRLSPLRRLWWDLGAAPGAAGKLRFLADLGLPPPDYMRARFGRDGRGWLPWLYLKRAAGGLHAAYRRGRARR